MSIFRIVHRRPQFGNPGVWEWFFNGYLQVNKRPLQGNGGILLTVEHCLGFMDGFQVLIEAEIQCADDEYLSPLSWRRRTTLTRSGNPVLSKVTNTEEAWVRREGAPSSAGEIVTKNSAGTEAVRPIPDRTAVNWTVPVVVERLSRMSGMNFNFNMLENLVMLRPNQTILYNGRQNEYIYGKYFNMTTLIQRGTGILPTQYWFDSKGKLQLMDMGHLYWLADDDARSEFIVKFPQVPFPVKLRK